MIKKILIFLFSVLMFNACSSSSAATASFSGELEGAPMWVKIPSIEGAMSAVGSAPANAGGDISYQRNQAMGDARDNFSKQMAIKVSTMIKSFKASTGAGADATFDQSSEQVSKQIASETLRGSKPKDMWISSKSGTMYILMVLDTESVIEQMDKNIKTSMGNEKAVYQKFLAKKAQGELSKELEAYKKDQ